MLQGTAKIFDATPTEDVFPHGLSLAPEPNRHTSAETSAQFQDPLDSVSIRPIILEGRLLIRGVDQSLAA